MKLVLLLALYCAPLFCQQVTSGAGSVVVITGSIPACLATPPTAGAAHATCYDTAGVLQQCNNGASACTTTGQWVAQQLPTATDAVNGGVTMSTATSSVAVATDDSRNTNSRTPTGSASGDLSGTYPSPTLAPLVRNSLGTTPTDALTLTNTTPAAAGAQQYSPANEQIGQQWVLLTAPTAPTSHAPSSGGACDDGTHYSLVTFLNATGETTMGAISAVYTCAASGNLQTEGLTGILAGPSGTTGRNVYRSKANAAHAVHTDFFLACASSPCIANNTTTTFSDALADASLGANPPSVNGTGNSQSVGFRSYVVPVQGTTTAGSYYGLFYHPPTGPDQNVMSVLPNLYFGIGTTSPAGLLDVRTPGVTNSSAVIIGYSPDAVPGQDAAITITTVPNAGTGVPFLSFWDPVENSRIGINAHAVQKALFTGPGGDVSGAFQIGSRGGCLNTVSNFPLQFFVDDQQVMLVMPDIHGSCTSYISLGNGAPTAPTSASPLLTLGSNTAYTIDNQGAVNSTSETISTFAVTSLVASGGTTGTRGSPAGEYIYGGQYANRNYYVFANGGTPWYLWYYTGIWYITAALGSPTYEWYNFGTTVLPPAGSYTAGGSSSGTVTLATGTSYPMGGLLSAVNVTVTGQSANTGAGACYKAGGVLGYCSGVGGVCTTCN